MRSLDDHLFGQGPKRILALDGGGVRGIMTCAVLEAMEAALARRLPEGKRADFRLSDYFDLIGGASTGAIMATWLALGHTAKETRQLYERLAGEVFRASKFLSRVGLKEKFDAKQFERVTDSAFEDFAKSKGLQPDYEVHFHDKLIRTGLAIFAKRIDKASPWILHNNPRSKFWDPAGPPWKDYIAKRPELLGTPNASFDLRRFVQASASAPYFLEPLSRTIAKDVTASFIDGGVSPHNNPSLQLLLMATLKWREPPPEAPVEAASPFGFGWDAGEDKLLLVSIGTGFWRKEPTGLFRGTAAHRALHGLTTMIDDASNAAITWMQALSRPERPYWLNFELEDMAGLRVVQEPLLSYARIDATLDADGLTRLLGAPGLKKLARSGSASATRKLLKQLRKLDNAKTANLRRLAQIGEVLGDRSFGSVSQADAILPRRFDPPTV